MKSNIIRILTLFSYYILLCLGLLSISWIIYVRFLRIRSIKDLPLSLSEYGFWLLLYICLLYLFSIIILFTKKTSNETAKILIEIIYKPMVTLDHFIRYNKYTKNQSYKLLEKFMKQLSTRATTTLLIMAFIFQIIPRVILITFLSIDIWYYHHIEIFYKVILIGFIPFIYRYLKYTLKDLKQQYIAILEEKYDTIWMIEIDITEDVKCDTDMEIKDYIEFKTHQTLYTTGTITSRNYVYYVHKEYNETIISKNDTYIKYQQENNIPLENKLTDYDYEIISQLFETLKPKLIFLSVFF